MTGKYSRCQLTIFSTGQLKIRQPYVEVCFRANTYSFDSNLGKK